MDVVNVRNLECVGMDIAVFTANMMYGNKQIVLKIGVAMEEHLIFVQIVAAVGNYKFILQISYMTILKYKEQDILVDLNIIEYGDIINICLDKFQIHMYQLSYIEIDGMILGAELSPYSKVNNIFIEQIIIHPRNDNMIYINCYNTYLASKNDEMMVRELSFSPITIRRPIMYFNMNTIPLSSVGDDIKVTVSHNDFQKMKTAKYSEIDAINTQCNICLCDFDPNDIVLKVSKCNHVFHNDCIKKWFLEESNKCPVCRIEVSKGNPQVETSNESILNQPIFNTNTMFNQITNMLTDEINNILGINNFTGIFGHHHYEDNEDIEDEIE